MIYFSDFTVPDSGASDPFFANVVFLSGFEGADGTTTISDEIVHGAATKVGTTAEIDTAQLKFGTSSLRMQSASLRWTDSDDWHFPGEFTVETWIRSANGQNGVYFVSQYVLSSTGRSWALGSEGGKLRAFVSTNGTGGSLIEGTASFTPTINTWFHIAMDRDASGDVRIYVDGVMHGKANVTGALYNANVPLAVGSRDNSFTFNGWLDELRITKGVARYASDGGFSVPSAAFPRA